MQIKFEFGGVTLTINSLVMLLNKQGKKGKIFSFSFSNLSCLNQML